MSYDVIIVGAGIAGLRVGLQLLRSKVSCCILEKYNYTGGRVVTFRTKLPKIGEIQWENGAGRISTRHHKVLSLLKRYHLTTAPISSHVAYYEVPDDTVEQDPFSQLHDIFLKPLYDLPKDVLQTHTIEELLDKTVGAHTAKQYYETFPYWSEIHTMRADAALASFDAEMGSMKGFVGCVEGLSSLIMAMKKDFLEGGGHIQYNTEVTALSQHDDGVHFVCQEQQTKSCITVVGHVGVLALHRNAVAKIQGVNHTPVLSHLRMEPLFRMYAVFPVRNGKSWFSELSKTVTNGRIRYFIPVNPSKGVVMISYTDGDDAKYWMKKSPATIQRMVMADIRKLFSDCTVPDPLLFKLHPWSDGCTYWLPGKYDIEEESKKSLHPMPRTIPGLFMCGESFSVHPCWMESALDQADDLLNLPTFQSKIKALK
jgi:monoamine oxidase